jgi:hypothetical protein
LTIFITYDNGVSSTPYQVRQWNLFKTSHWQSLSHNVVSSTPYQVRQWNLFKTSHWQSLSHNVVSSTPYQVRQWNLFKTSHWQSLSHMIMLYQVHLTKLDSETCLKQPLNKLESCVNRPLNLVPLNFNLSPIECECLSNSTKMFVLKKEEEGGYFR